MEVDTQAIQKIEEDSRSLVELANAHNVQNQADADAANIILTKITAGISAAEKRRKSITGPLNESLRNINAMVKVAMGPVYEAKTRLTTRLMDWRAAEQRKIREEEERRAEEARKKDEMRHKVQESHEERGHKTHELEPTPVEEVAPLARRDTTKVQKRWDFEVVNSKTVPEEYKDVNTGRLRKAIFANRDEDGKPTIEIPGVSIFQKEVPVFA